jgi:integrase
MANKQPSEGKLFRRSIRLPSDDGKRHRCVVSAYTERELEIKYREKLMELAKTDYRFAKTITIENFFPHFLEVYVRPHVRDNAYKDKKARLQTYLIDPLGRQELSEIPPSALQKILNSQKGKSRSFLSKLKGEITAFFDAAEDENLLTKNPARRLFLPPCEDQERRALTLEERAAFLKAAEKHKHGLLFLVMYYCGLRPGEAKALTYADIDYNRQCLSVNKALENHTGIIKPPKTKSGIRTVPIPDALFQKLPRKKGKELLFQGDRTKKPLSEATYSRAWQSLLNLMDVELGAKRYRNKIIPETSVVDRKLTPYYLRHTYCSMLPELGVDIKTAQYFMGHANISVTANTYQHITERMFENGASRIVNM